MKNEILIKSKEDRTQVGAVIVSSIVWLFIAALMLIDRNLELLWKILGFCAVLSYVVYSFFHVLTTEICFDGEIVIQKNIFIKRSIRIKNVKKYNIEKSFRSGGYKNIYCFYDINENIIMKSWLNMFVCSEEYNSRYINFWDGVVDKLECEIPDIWGIRCERR